MEKDKQSERERDKVWEEIERGEKGEKVVFRVFFRAETQISGFSFSSLKTAIIC